MNVVGKVGSLISQSVYTIVTPFHPFGGAVDVIVVQQQDGTFRSTPWYVRFGKFQGVLKGGEQIVRISVNGIEANFHMYLDNSGEAYFAKEVDDEKVDTDDNTGMEMANAHRFTHSVSDAAVLALKRDEDSFDAPRIQRTESDSGRRYFDFQDDRSSFEGSVDLSEYESNPYDTLDGDNYVDSQDSHPEMVLFSGDGQVLTAPISESENNTDTLQLETPKFHLGPGEGGEFIPGESALATDYISQTDASVADVPTNSHCHTNSVVHISEVQMESHQEEDGQVIHHVKETLRVESQDESCNIQNDSVEGRSGMTRHGVFKSCLELQEFPEMSGNDDLLDKDGSSEDQHSAEDTCAIRPVVENEEGSIAQSRYDDGFSPSDTSVSSVDSRSSELRPQDVEKKVSGEVKTDSGRHSIIDVAISNDEHTGKSASTEELDDIQQTLVPEDHSDKSEVVEPQIAASSKEAQSHPGLNNVLQIFILGL